MPLIGAASSVPVCEVVPTLKARGEARTAPSRKGGSKRGGDHSRDPHRGRGQPNGSQFGGYLLSAR